MGQGLPQSSLLMACFLHSVLSSGLASPGAVHSACCSGPRPKVVLLSPASLLALLQGVPIASDSHMDLVPTVAASVPNSRISPLIFFLQGS